jgi:hypothetical protein
MILRMPSGIVSNASTWINRKLQGKCNFQGLPISIENYRGSYRQGMDSDGRIWKTFMHFDYGYIRLTKGTDGDHVDVYIGPNKTSDKVFIIHQKIPGTNTYDEDKCMLGFSSIEDAKAAYLRQYDKPGFFQGITTVSMAAFKIMLKEKRGMKLKKSLCKAKYIKKIWKNGRWNYVYPQNGNTHRIGSMDSYTIQKNLGGSTGGALLITTPDFKQKIMKQSTGEKHLRDEYTANKLYSILGVAVPNVKLAERRGNLVQVADYIKGTPLNELPGEERDKAEKQLLSGFVADALLGNWDVLGMSNDNIIWDGKKAWRVDNGGSLRYRAQGEPKGESFGNEVTEIDSMREPGRSASRIFNNITNDEIQNQVAKVLEKKSSILAAINDPSLRKIMEKRIESLRLIMKLEKAGHKYFKRWKGSDGKWRYSYYESSFKGGGSKPTGGEKGTLEGMSRAEAQAVIKSFRRRAPGDGREKTIQKESHLFLLLKETTFCMMSAGRNPEDPEDMKMTDAQIENRHKDLLNDLKSKGYVFTSCKGKYVNPEESVMVMAHDADRDDMMSLGAKYKQDSIVFSSKGKGSLIYTTGKKKGQAEMSGEGYEVVPNADDFYTKMPLANGKTIKFTINLEELAKALRAMGVPIGTLIKSDSGKWYLYSGSMVTRFYWFKDEPMEKANGTRSYYSPEEVKAKGMRWVTIRGSRVLLQGTSDGGYVVVGGAGGKLNHLKIDKVLSKEEYASRRQSYKEKGAEKTQELTKEEIAEAAKQRKAQVEARRSAREAYTQKITDILGTTPEEIKSKITTDEMEDIESRARMMVESRKSTLTGDSLQTAVEDQIEKEVKKAVQKKVKSVERQALETLMNDYMPSDPNSKESLKSLLDTDKAMEVLSARKSFRKTLKDIGKSTADTPTDLRVGSVFAGASKETVEQIQKEVRDQIETAKNIEMYDLLNAQNQSINSHIDQGSISALNGLISDVYGGGATFSTDAVKELGIEAVVRAVTIKLQNDGKGEAVKKALEEYVSTEREKIVDAALAETKKRMKNADDLRSLARDSEDAEAILSMASANGHALKQITASQRALGTAVGSLRAAAHMINALDDPPADIVQVDMGKDLVRARKRAKAAGLKKGEYSMRTVKRGKGKRLVMEIPKDSLNNFFQHNKESISTQDRLTKIKSHKANTGYKPPGIKENIKLDPAQEAGLHFFKEQGRVLLDFKAGLGKTATAYAAAMEAIHNNGAKKVLIVAPSGPAGDFYDQRKTFLTPEMQKIVHNSAKGSKSKRNELHMKSSDAGPMIHIVTQDSLRQDSKMLKEAGYDMVVVDEIHEMTAGSGKAGRYAALRQLDDVPMKIAMSGTNIKNSKEELYRKINFIDPDHTLGSMADFNKRYKGLNQATGIFSDAANDAFRKEMGQWMYSQDYALPIKNNTQTLRIPLSASQRKKYAESERIYKEARNSGVKGAAAQRDSRNYAIITDGGAMENAKVSKMIDIMEQSHKGEKAVIHVSRPGVPIKKAMKTAIGQLESKFGKGSVGVIDGDSSAAELRKVKAAFNDPGNPMRFIIGTKTLESGHNLQGGGTVTFHLDIPDSYAALQQRDARVFRKGQDKDTSSYVLSGTNPMDMRSEDLLDTKQKEMGILGNPREVEALDDTGFLGMLKKYEMEARGGQSA